MHVVAGGASAADADLSLHMLYISIDLCMAMSQFYQIQLYMEVSRSGRSAHLIHQSCIHRVSARTIQGEQRGPGGWG